MKVAAPTWLMYSLPDEIARLLRAGQPHRVRVVEYGADTRIELLILPDDVADVALAQLGLEDEPIDDCCHVCP